MFRSSQLLDRVNREGNKVLRTSVTYYITPTQSFGFHCMLYEHVSYRNCYGDVSNCMECSSS